MNYEEQIEQFINSHIKSLLAIEVNSTLSPKVSGHITRTKEIQKIIQSPYGLGGVRLKCGIVGR